MSIHDKFIKKEKEESRKRAMEFFDLFANADQKQAIAGLAASLGAEEAVGILKSVCILGMIRGIEIIALALCTGEIEELSGCKNVGETMDKLIELERKKN